MSVSGNQLSDERTKFSSDGAFTVRGTILDLDDGKVEITKCPSCGVDGKFEFSIGNEVIPCDRCGEEVFLTDSLRIHEQVSDFGDCSSAITRFMNATEQLLVATFVRMLLHYQPQALSEMAFILDGPLAVFGQPAKISFSLVRLYSRVAAELNKRGFVTPIILGLQKDGAVMEHARSIEPYLPENSFRIIDDGYRNSHIAPVNNANFGSETYFGQDFLFKSRNGRIFDIALPYPFPSKSGTAEFSKKEAIVGNYAGVVREALDIVQPVGNLDLFRKHRSSQYAFASSMHR